MRFRVVNEGGAKPWAVIVEGPTGEQLDKRDYKTREAALKGRDTLFKAWRGE